MTVRPIIDTRGAHDFNEVAITDLLLPRDALLGKDGDGWTQVTAKLAFERSRPDRFLSAFTLLVELFRALGPDAPERAVVAIGRLTSHIMALRHLPRSVAGMPQGGGEPGPASRFGKGSWEPAGAGDCGGRPPAGRHRTHEERRVPAAGYGDGTPDHDGPNILASRRHP